MFTHLYLRFGAKSYEFGLGFRLQLSPRKIVLKSLFKTYTRAIKTSTWAIMMHFFKTFPKLVAQTNKVRRARLIVE